MEIFPDTATLNLGPFVQFDMSTSGSTNDVFEVGLLVLLNQWKAETEKRGLETILCLLHLVSLMEQKLHTRVSSQLTLFTFFKHISSLNVHDS